MRVKPQWRSNRCAIVNRTVSFNVEDPYQAELLQKSQQFPNFSAAVKRWLSGECEGMKTTTPVPMPNRTALPASDDVRPGNDFDPVSALF